MDESTAKTEGEVVDSKETKAAVEETNEQTSPESPSTENPDDSKASNNSEYETVDESEEDDNDNGGKRRSGDLRSGSETEGSVIQEREEGDGQESVPVKKVDDDEDKKNPQYIPKRGTFYEHDDRTADDVETPEAAEAEKENKKKVWQDKKEKWSHDRYNDSEQAPKTRSELISIYGYDIRNEDGPPRARRRRRYGRGPNKYTRNWEDEDAYSKPPAPRPKKPLRKPRSGDEFPPLAEKEDSKENAQEEQKENVNVVKEKHVQEDKGSTSTQQPNISLSTTEPTVKQEIKSQMNVLPQNGKSPVQQHQQQRVGTGRVIKPKKEIKDSDYKGFTRPRNYRNPKAEQKTPPKKSNKEAEFIHTRNFTNKSQTGGVQEQELEGEMARLNIQEGGSRGSGSKQGGPRQGSVPPRLQGEQKSSKRYSSLRQRSLPETAAPPFTQHPQSFYPNDYGQAQQSQQQIMHPSATAQVPQIPPPPIPPIPQPVTGAVSAAPILQAPPQFAPPPFAQAPPPPFLQAGVAAAPPPFMAQQTPPQIINYVQSQAQYAQPPYQGYQQAFGTVNQPPELYQPQGGITYYSAQEQQVAQRAAPLKRPKAAIPIVPPPPSEPRGRGRGLNLPEPSPNASAEVVAEKPYEIAREFEDAPIAVEQ